MPAPRDAVAVRSRKDLTCPSCGVLLAHAVYRRNPPLLVLTSPVGDALVPERVSVQLLRARQRGDEDAVASLERHVAEFVVELPCHNDHRTLRTVPQLVRGVRPARGQWVYLRSSG